MKKHTEEELSVWGERELIEEILRLQGNKADKQENKVNSYTSDILDIVDNVEEFDRSDLQGAIQAVIKKAIEE